jgi:hypothetical protein
MPTISSFYGIMIRMFYNDHAPPHFHARYGEFEATWGFRRRRTLIPEGTRTAFRAEGEQFSDRSDAGTSIVQEVFGFVKNKLSGA